MHERPGKSPHESPELNRGPDVQETRKTSDPQRQYARLLNIWARAVKAHRRQIHNQGGAGESDRVRWLALAQSLSHRRIPLTFLPGSPTMAVIDGPMPIVLVAASKARDQQAYWTWPVIGIDFQNSLAMRSEFGMMQLSARLARRMGRGGWEALALAHHKLTREMIWTVQTDPVAIEVLAALQAQVLPWEAPGDWPDLARLYRHRGQWLEGFAHLVPRYPFLQEVAGRVSWLRGSDPVDIEDEDSVHRACRPPSGGAPG